MPSATPSLKLGRLPFTEPAPTPVMAGDVHGALTDMYAYALALEAESGRLASGEVREEVAALRDAISVLRAQVGPAADHLQL